MGVPKKARPPVMGPLAPSLISVSVTPVLLPVGTGATVFTAVVAMAAVVAATVVAAAVVAGWLVGVLSAPQATNSKLRIPDKAVKAAHPLGFSHLYSIDTLLCWKS